MQKCLISLYNCYVYFKSFYLLNDIDLFFMPFFHCIIFCVMNVLFILLLLSITCHFVNSSMLELFYILLYYIVDSVHRDATNTEKVFSIYFAVFGIWQCCYEDCIYVNKEIEKVPFCFLVQCHCFMFSFILFSSGLNICICFSFVSVRNT